MKPVRSFYFSDEPYLSVLKGLYQALRAPEAFVKLLGKPRTGKSTLCEKLSQFLERKGQRVCYFNTAIESPDMLRSLLARQLDLPDSANFARLMEDALADVEAVPLVLIFDDAHLLTDITLIEISRLAEVQQGNRRLINVLLCGEPALSQRLVSHREFKSLLLHVSHSFTLEAMGQEAVQQFLRQYGDRVGMPELTLEADALSYFYKTTRGFPGPVLTLSRSLLSARAGRPQPGPVTRSELLRLVQQAPAMELPPSSGLRASTRRLGVVPLAGVVVIASLALLYQQLGNGDSDAEPPEPPAQPDSEADTPQASPFTPDEPPAPDLADAEPDAETVAQSVSVEPSVPPDNSVQQDTSSPTDSGLSLVTAAEAGLDASALTEPVFETLTGAPVPDAVAPASPESPAPDSDEPAPVQDSADPAPASSAPTADIAQTAPSNSAPPAARPQSIAMATAEAAPEEELSPLDAVQSWLDAWQSRSLDNYFAHYHDDFQPRYQNSPAAWRANRQRVIGNAESISLALSGFEVLSQEADQVEVQFWLAYESPGYSDNTLKKLVLRRSGRQWLIVEEVNLIVR